MIGKFLRNLRTFGEGWWEKDKIKEIVESFKFQVYKGSESLLLSFAAKLL
jgi:hypothetical protein